MKIFLSSTYIDLIAHRQAVTEAQERLGQQVGRMEIFGARPNEPLEVCLEEINSCDIFVGIYAHRYGYVPYGSSTSITEQEFLCAHEKNKPLFCFMVSDEYAWPPSFIEGEPNQTKLQTFKAKVRTSFVVDFFKEPLDLAVKTATAIGRYIINNQELLTISPQDNKEKEQRNALVALLEERKNIVVEVIKSSDTNCKLFLQLHEQNIAAIRKGEMLLSHLLIADIHSLIERVITSQHDRTNQHARGFSLPNILYKKVVFDARPDFVPWYPYDIESNVNKQQLEWNKASQWCLRDVVRSWKGKDLANNESLLWREQLLLEWLHLEIKPLEEELSTQRRIAALDRGADARGNMQARIRPDSTVTCPHCQKRFITKLVIGERENCPSCRTHIELVERVEPTSYQGHLMLDGVCVRCGSSKTAVDHFGFKCN